MSGEGAASLSSLGGVILIATIYGRNLTHLHRPVGSDNDHDLNGPFWKRHRALDNIILNTSLAIPPNLRLPAGLNDPNTIFLNMNIHTATICLHQAAIFKADKNRLPAQISAESKRRCIVAADQVTNIMKMISHIDMSVVCIPHFISTLLRIAIVMLTWFFTDESLPSILLICLRPCVCPISQSPEGRHCSQIIASFLTCRDASFDNQKSVDRVVFGTARCGP